MTACDSGAIATGEQVPIGSSGHMFGGSWTEVKLDAISDYLTFYNRALKNVPSPEWPFTRWYVDAFAGSGERTEAVSLGGLLEGELERTEIVSRPGSAQKALAIDPPFDHLVFIEDDIGRYGDLCRLVESYQHRNLQCLRGDANEQLQRLFGSDPWGQQKLGKGKHRAVVFLDPYALEVKWETLSMLARTGAVDVWYLFNLQAVVRQLAHDYSAVDQVKQMSLDEIFGTPAWRSELYETKVEVDLFSAGERTSRKGDKRQIEAYFKGRLEKIFGFVSDPLPLIVERNLQKFSLFCASNNPSPQAIALIKKGVKHVLENYRPGASRRTSAL